MARLPLIAFWLVLLAILILRFSFYVGAKVPFQAGDTVSLVATVQSEPTLKGNVQRFEIAHKGSIVHVWTSRFPTYHYGDSVRISGTMESFGDVSRDFRIYFPTIEHQEQSKPALLILIDNVRQHIVRTIGQVLPGNSAALLTGILLGSKEGFSSGFLEALRNTGTLHVVAASGMNVSILASFVMAIFLRFFKRRVASMFVVIAIFFYTSLALFQPAIVRASIMGIALFVGSMLNRQTPAAWFLALACYAMLLFDPLLVFDIGFQLSFAATAGLLFLMPVFEKTFRWFSFLKNLPLLGDGATTTIVAQLATLPVVLGNFGTISPLSIPVNTLILWTAQPLMFLSIIAAILSFLPVLAFPVLLATLPLLLFFENAVVLFDRPAMFSVVQFPFAVGLGYYCLLVGYYFFLKKHA